MTEINIPALRELAKVVLAQSKEFAKGTVICQPETILTLCDMAERGAVDLADPDDEMTLNKLSKLLAGVYPLRPSYDQIAATILTWMRANGYRKGE